MPLIVWVVKDTELPPVVIEVSVFVPELIGSIAWRPFAPAPGLTSRVRTLPLHEKLEKVEAFLAFVQSSSCLALMTGTLWLCADAMMASESAEAALSVWMLATYEP